MSMFKYETHTRQGSCPAHGTVKGEKHVPQGHITVRDHRGRAPRGGHAALPLPRVWRKGLLTPITGPPRPALICGA